VGVRQSVQGKEQGGVTHIRQAQRSARVQQRVLVGQAVYEAAHEVGREQRSDVVPVQRGQQHREELEAEKPAQRAVSAGCEHAVCSNNHALALVR
jgi:hypothetical protein